MFRGELDVTNVYDLKRNVIPVHGRVYPGINDTALCVVLVDFRNELVWVEPVDPDGDDDEWGEQWRIAVRPEDIEPMPDDEDSKENVK